MEDLQQMLKSLIPRLKSSLPGETVSDDLAMLLLEGAAEDIRGYCNRQDLPAGSKTYIVRLAVIAYNRMGTEGEAGHSEGGVSRTYYPSGLPPDIAAALTRYRQGSVICL